MSKVSKNNGSPGYAHDPQSTQERIEMAVSNWKKHGDLSSHSLESKIKCIGGANLIEASQFQNLQELLKEIFHVDPADLDNMKNIVFPGIENLARELQPEDCGILMAGQEGKLEVSKRRIAQILANSFFCNFSQNTVVPHFNFDLLFSTHESNIQKSKPKREKLKCLLSYFKAVTTEPRENTSSVAFERVCVDAEIFNGGTVWQFPLSKMTIESTANTLDCSEDVAQVDFACRQEDIKFVTCPELIAAQFFAEPLEDNEALIITGAKPYSTYKGFDKSFEFTGEADPNAPCSDVVIAIDATDFSRLAKGDQYTQQYIMREIVKAYAGFVKCPTSKIATGNWGCGAFQGDPLLKMMVQWIAAAMAQKELIYFCFGDVKLANEMSLVVQKHESSSAGDLYGHLLIKPENRGFAGTVTSSFAWFKKLILGDKNRAVGNIPNAPNPPMIAETSDAHAHDTPESVPTAEEAKPEDEFQFIRDAAKRDNVELLRASSLVNSKPTTANFIKLIECHANASFDNSLYNILTEIEMHLSKDTLYKPLASCIFECASQIRNEAGKLLAACYNFKEEEKCVLTRRQIACLLANIFLCTFQPATQDQPNISLATFFKLCSKRDDDYKNKLFSLLGYFWDIIEISNSDNPEQLDEDQVIFSLYSLKPSDLIEDKHITVPDEGKFTVCQTRQVIGGSVLEPLEFGEEERIFLAHPEMIAARIFCHAPLKAGKALLFQNLRICNKNILSGTFYEDYARNNGLENSAFALINESYL